MPACGLQHLWTSWINVDEHGIGKPPMSLMPPSDFFSFTILRVFAAIAWSVWRKYRQRFYRISFRRLMDWSEWFPVSMPPNQRWLYIRHASERLFSNDRAVAFGANKTLWFFDEIQARSAQELCVLWVDDVNFITCNRRCTVPFLGFQKRSGD
jgi:hypothetical protein